MTVQPEDVADRLRRVREDITRACDRAGRTPDSVQLVAVCKRIPLPLVVAACRAGQWDLGENRIQEAVSRRTELPPLLAGAGLDPGAVRWHFIGHLQRNKAGKAVGAFHLLHAVDSLRLAERLAKLAAEAGQTQRVLIEVNQSREPQKHGILPEAAVDLVSQVAALGPLEPEGLMTMARFGAAEAELRETFAGLRRLCEDARGACGLPLPHLSMGMTDDYAAAIAEGATIVRIGTAIFGPRQ
jgi:pyridoxal phosphate enzyme (YggS family)